MGRSMTKGIAVSMALLGIILLLEYVSAGGCGVRPLVIDLDLKPGRDQKLRNSF